MATHFVCQSTEPLPHVYPTGLAQKSHGAVSQYEVYNSGNKAHTHFPPPGWDFSQTSEEDSLPLLQPAPQPEWRNTSLRPDPELCITPQKTQTSAKSLTVKQGHEKNHFEPDPLLMLTPEKSYLESEKIYDKSYYSNADKGKKVRFDIEDSAEKQLNLMEKTAISEKDASLLENCDTHLTKKFSSNKVYQPELYDDSSAVTEDNVDKLQKGNSRTVRYTVGKHGDEAVYVKLPNDGTISESTVMKSDRQSASGLTADTHCASKDNQSLPVKVVREKPASKTASDPIAMCRVPEEVGQKRKVKVLRENQYMPKQTEYSYPFSQGTAEFAGGEEHLFTRPEYNSTLKMKLEADKLKHSEIDVETALKKQLTLSGSTKTDINEKAAAHVNKQGSSYSGLVSLDLPANEICKQAAELKTARAKLSTVTKHKQKEQREPDLLEFFTGDRLRESVTYSLTGISAPSEQLSMAPHWRAFDLYKHNRVWEGRGSNRK